MFRIPPSPLAPAVGLSPNTETPRRKLSRLPQPEIGFIKDKPTLKSLTVQHRVRIRSAGGDVQRLVCMKLTLSPEASARLVKHAIANSNIFSELPSTTMEATEPLPSLVPHGVDLRLNDRNEMSGRQQWVSRERMCFPGTATEMHARVCEMFVVRERDDTRKKGVQKFFASLAAFTSKKSGEQGDVKLSSPKHVGTVAAFELGDYLLYRQLEKKASNFDRIKEKFGRRDAASSGEAPKRKLLVEGHGVEQIFDEERQAGVPQAVSLPEGVTISHGAPCGMWLATMVGNKRQARPDEIQDVARVRAQWPVYCSHSLAGSRHRIAFMGRDVAPSDATGSYSLVNAADLFLLASGFDPAEGHGKMKNVALYSFADLRDEHSPRARKRDSCNSFQRGNVTEDGLAFAALNTPNTSPVDILVPKPGHEGHIHDLITQLRDKGILSQYDEIHFQVCRENENLYAFTTSGSLKELRFDPHTGLSNDWVASIQNLPRKDMPTIVEFDKAEAYPKVTQAHPDHARHQLKPDALPSFVPRKLSEVSL